MKRFFVILLGAILLATSFTGCADNGDSENTLVIGVYDGGYGTDWVYALQDGFLQEYPDAKVRITKFIEITDAETQLMSGKTSTDLFFSVDPLVKYQYGSVTVGGTNYDCILEDLSGLIEETIPGETKSIDDKLNPDYKEMFEIVRDNGNTAIYNLPWAIGLLGIVKNNKVWKSEWSVPRTTDELFALCDQILADGSVPFIYSLSDSYYSYLFETFAAQYEGVEMMDNIWNCIDQAGNRYKPEFILSDGILESYKIMEKLLKNSNGYQHEDSKDITFTSAQSLFLNETNKIAMMMNGDWLQNEMRANYDPEKLYIEFMKTPVISALETKLGLADGVLEQLVDYVDEKTDTAPTFTSGKGLSEEEVIAAVREARNIIPVNGNMHAAYIPAYSNAKDLAKKFLQYMASDKGLAIFESSIGYALPYDYDWLNGTESANMTDFIKKSLEDNYVGKEMYGTMRKKNKIFCMGGLSITNNTGTKFEAIFSASNPNDYKSAETLYNENYTFIKGRWNTYLSLSGLV